MLIRYHSNNSGGNWWLSDEDWKNLEEAGWEVDWVKNQKGIKTRDGRWLGALATTATKDFFSLEEAISEWEKITGKSAHSNGCDCCGPPHSFTDWG